MPTDAMSAWVDFAADCARGTGDPFPIGTILDLLCETYATTAQWTSINGNGGIEWVVLGAPSGWPEPWTIEYAAAHVDRHPVARWFVHAHSSLPMTIGRVPEAVADHALVAQARDVLGPDMGQEMPIPIRTSSSPRRGAFTVSRGGQDFSDDELELATQVQPLLMLLDRLSNLATRVDGPVRETFGLTQRETMVVDLLRRGLTHTTMGRHLGCSPRTVEKHLEHVYRKLGAHDRLEAIRRFEAHLPSRDHPPADTAGTPRLDQRPDLLVIRATVPAEELDLRLVSSTNGEDLSI